MVALWLPNAASESLEKKKFVSICLGHLNAASESLEKKKFVSICLGHLGPEHLVPPQLFPI